MCVVYVCVFSVCAVYQCQRLKTSDSSTEVTYWRMLQTGYSTTLYTDIIGAFFLLSKHLHVARVNVVSYTPKSKVRLTLWRFPQNLHIQQPFVQVCFTVCHIEQRFSWRSSGSINFFGHLGPKLSKSEENVQNTAKFYLRP